MTDSTKLNQARQRQIVNVNNASNRITITPQSRIIPTTEQDRIARHTEKNYQPHKPNPVGLDTVNDLIRSVDLGVNSGVNNSLTGLYGGAKTSYDIFAKLVNTPVVGATALFNGEDVSDVIKESWKYEYTPSTQRVSEALEEVGLVPTDKYTKQVEPYLSDTLRYDKNQLDKVSNTGSEVQDLKNTLTHYYSNPRHLAMTLAQEVGDMGTSALMGSAVTKGVGLGGKVSAALVGEGLSSYGNASNELMQRGVNPDTLNGVLTAGSIAGVNMLTQKVLNTKYSPENMLDNLLRSKVADSINLNKARSDLLKIGAGIGAEATEGLITGGYETGAINYATGMPITQGMGRAIGEEVAVGGSLAGITTALGVSNEPLPIKEDNSKPNLGKLFTQAQAINKQKTQKINDVASQYNISITSASNKVNKENPIQVAIMGDYSKKDTGRGTNDHYDLRLARGADGKRGDINPYLDRFIVNGKPLNSYKQTGKYMEQRDGYKHEGVDYGFDNSFGRDANARNLFINPKYEVTNITAFDNNKHGGGWVTQVTFSDGIKVNILHQNKEGALSIADAFKQRKSVGSSHYIKHKNLNLGATPYDDLMKEIYTKYGYTEQEQRILKAQLAQESAFNPNAKSHAGAKGIAQFLDGTAKQYGVNVNDVASSIDGQARFMRDLLKKSNGNWEMALAFYNAGAGSTDAQTRFNKVKNFKETNQYYNNILANAGADFGDTSIDTTNDTNNVLNELNSLLNQWEQEEANAKNEEDKAKLQEQIDALKNQLAEIAGLEQQEQEIKEQGKQIFAGSFNDKLTELEIDVNPFLDDTEKAEYKKQLGILRGDETNIDASEPSAIIPKTYDEIEQEYVINTSNSEEDGTTNPKQTELINNEPTFTQRFSLSNTTPEEIDSNPKLTDNQKRAIHKMMDVQRQVANTRDVQGVTDDILVGSVGNTTLESNRGLQDYITGFENAINANNIKAASNLLTDLQYLRDTRISKNNAINQALQLVEDNNIKDINDAPIIAQDADTKEWFVTEYTGLREGYPEFDGSNALTIFKPNKLTERLDKEAKLVDDFTNAWADYLSDYNIEGTQAPTLDTSMATVTSKTANRATRSYDEAEATFKGREFTQERVKSELPPLTETSKNPIDVKAGKIQLVQDINQVPEDGVFLGRGRYTDESGKSRPSSMYDMEQGRINVGDAGWLASPYNPPRQGYKPNPFTLADSKPSTHAEAYGSYFKRMFMQDDGFAEAVLQLEPSKLYRTKYSTTEAQYIDNFLQNVPRESVESARAWLNAHDIAINKGQVTFVPKEPNAVAKVQKPVQEQMQGMEYADGSQLDGTTMGKNIRFADDVDTAQTKGNKSIENLYDKPFTPSKEINTLTELFKDDEYSTKLYQHLSKLNPDAKVELVSDVSRLDKSIQYDIEQGGKYYPSTNTITINTNPVDWQGSQLELINHELTHSVTVDVIGFNDIPSKMTGEQKKQSEEIDVSLGDWLFQNYESIDSYINDRMNYAHQSNYPHELVAVFSAEKQVRNTLKELNPELYAKIQSFIKSIMESKINESNSKTNKRELKKDIPTSVSQTTTTRPTGVDTSVPRATGSTRSQRVDESPKTNLGESKSIEHSDTKSEPQRGDSGRLEKTNQERPKQLGIFTKQTTPSISTLAKSKEQVEAEKSKHWKQQNHLILGFNQKLDTPLAFIHDLASHLNHDLDKGLSELVPSISANDVQKAQVVQFLQFNESFSEALIKYFTKDIGKDGTDYSYRDFKGYLVKDDGSFDENTLTALSLSAYSYILQNNKEKNSYKDIAKLLHYPDEVEIPSESLSKFLYMGDVYGNVANNIGRDAYTYLGLKTNKDVSELYASRMQSSLGNWVVATLVNEGYLFKETMSKAEFTSHFHEGMSVDDDATIDHANSTASFISFTKLPKNGLRVQKDAGIQLIVDAGKGTKGYLSKLFGGDVGLRSPTFEPTDKVKRDIKGTTAKVSDTQAEKQKLMQQEPIVINQSAFDGLKKLLDAYPDETRQMLGALVTDETLNKVHESRRLSMQAKAEGNQRELDRLLGLVAGLEKDEDGSYQAFYDSNYVTNNNRGQYNSNEFNMQTMKLHRAMGEYANFKTVIDADDIQIHGVVEDFIQDGKLTKLGHLFAAIAENAEGTEDDIKSLMDKRFTYMKGFTVDKIKAEDFLPVFYKYLQTNNQVQDAVQAINKLQADKPLSKQELSNITDVVTKWGMGALSFRALVEYSRFKQAQQDNDDFIHSFGLGADGVNNGSAISYTLMGLVNNKENPDLPTQIGILDKDGKHFTFHDTRKDNLLDYYEGLAKIMNTVEDDYDEELRQDINLFYNLNPSIKGRKGAKEVLIPAGYGAGIARLKSVAFASLIKDIKTKYENIYNAYVDGLDYQDKFDELQLELQQVMGNKGFRLPKPEEMLKDDKFLTIEQIEIIRKEYDKTIGKLIADSFDKYTHSFSSARKENIRFHEASANMYMIVHKAQSDKALQTKKEKIKQDLITSHKDMVEASLAKSKTTNSFDVMVDKLAQEEIDFVGLSKQEYQDLVEKPLSKVVPKINHAFNYNEPKHKRHASDIRILKSQAGVVPNGFKDGFKTLSTNGKVERNQVALATRKWVSAGVRPNSAQVQGVDARIAFEASSMNGRVSLNVHDNVIAGYDNYVAMVRTLNKTYYETTRDYHANLASVNGFLDTLSGLVNIKDGIDEEVFNVSFSESIMTFLPLDKDNKKKFRKDILDKKQEAFEYIHSVIKGAINRSIDRDIKKVKDYENIGIIHQYAGHGGEYTLTNEDKQKEKEQIEKLTKNKELVLERFDKLMGEVFGYGIVKSESTDSLNIWYSSGENAELSNLALRPFKAKNGRSYHSVEHFYQSHKTGKLNPTVYNDSRWGKGGVKIARGKPRTDNDFNLKLMKEGIKLSFEQNLNARVLLLSTGNIQLTHIQDRGIWGKEFPRLLMEVRDELRDEHNVEISYRYNKNSFGERSNLRELPDIPVVKIKTKQLGFKDTKKLADEILRQIQKTDGLYNKDTGWVLQVGKKDRKKMGNNKELSHTTSQSVQGIEELVTNAIVAETHEDIKHQNTDVIAVHRLYVPALINGNLHRVKLTVKDYILTDGSERKNLHAIEAVEIETSVAGNRTTQPVGSSTNHNGSKLSITTLLKGVKHDGDDGIFFANQRTIGFKDLEIEQQEQSLPKPYSLNQLKKSVGKLRNDSAEFKLFDYLVSVAKNNKRLAIIMTEDFPSEADGMYDNKTNTIYLRPSIMSNNELSADRKIRLINHELLHALTETGIRLGKEQDSKAYKDMQKMYEQIKQKANGQYAKELADMNEFIAYGLTDAKFRAFIADNLDTKSLGVKSSKIQSALDTFLKAVYSILGFNTSHNFKVFAKTVDALIIPYEPIQGTGVLRHSASAMKSNKANIERGMKAMNQVITTKADKKRAMYRNDIGWIDFVWGSTGVLKANGKTKGAMGISHIIEARMRKDGMDYREVTRMLTEDIVKTIALGTQTKEYNQGKSTSLHIEYMGYRASLIKTKGSNSWVINAFELFDKESDGDVVKSIGSSTSTHTTPILHRDGMGASDKNSIAPKDIPFKQRYSQSDVTSDMSTVEVIQSLDSSMIDSEHNQRLDDLTQRIIGIFGMNSNQDTLVDNSKILQSDALVHGFRMSDKEIAVYNSLHAIFTAMETHKANHNYQSLVKLYSDAKKQLSYKDFLTTDRPTPEDILEAKSKYDYLFNSKEHLNDRIAVFASLGLANEEMVNILQKPRQLKERELNTWFDELMAILDKIVKALTEKAFFKGGKDFQSQLNVLSDKLLKVDADVRANKRALHERAWQGVGFLTKPLNMAIKSAMRQGIKPATKLKGSDNGILDTIGRTAETFAKLHENGSEEKMQKVIENILSIQKGAYNELGELVNEVSGFVGSGSKRTIERLLRVTQSLGRARDMWKTSVMNNILKEFPNNGKDLTKEQKSAVTRTLLRTDVSSLLDGNNTDYVIRLIKDSKFRKQEIGELHSLILSQGFSKSRANGIIMSAMDLAAYLSHEEVPDNLYKNAEGIARFYGVESDTNILKAIDKLATIQALSYVDNKDIDTVNDMLEKYPDALINLLELHKAYATISKEQEFAQNKYSYQKGYLPQKTNSLRSLQFAKSIQEVEKLKNEGWELITKDPQGMKKDSADHTDPKYLMFHKNINYREYNSGALEMKDTHAKGAIIYTHRDHKDINRYIRDKDKKMVDRNTNVDPKDYNPFENTGNMVMAYDPEGAIINVHYEMRGSTRDKYLERDNSFDVLMGMYAYGINTTPVIREQQKNVAKALYEDFKSSYKKEPHLFMVLDPKSKDPKIQEMYRMMPYSFRAQAREMFGQGNPIMVRKSLFLTVFGYRQLSLADLFDKQFNDLGFLGKGFVSGSYLFLGKKAKGRITAAEYFTNKLTKIGKDFIVIRNPKVLKGNIIANSLMLMLHGINPVTVVKEYLRVWKQGRDYVVLEKEMYDLMVEINKAKGKRRQDIQNEINDIQARLVKHPMHVYFKEGIMSSIVDEVQVDGTDSYGSIWEEKFDEYKNKLISKEMQQGIDFFMMNKGSPLHNAMSSATQFSDFSAKVILVEHLKKSGMSEKMAIAEAQETFINYDIPASPMVDYASRMGFFMFINFLKRYQKPLVKSLSRTPASTILQHMITENFTNEAGILDPFILNRIGNNPFDMGMFDIVSVPDDILTMKLMDAMIPDVF